MSTEKKHILFDNDSFHGKEENREIILGCIRNL
jgi:hypothetical protein